MPQSPITIRFVDEAQLAQEPAAVRSWCKASGFVAQPGQFCLVPGMAVGVEGAIAQVLLGQPTSLDTWSLGLLSTTLPPGHYALEADLPGEIATKLCLGWKLGQYRFDRYKQAGPTGTPAELPELQIPSQADSDYIEAAVAATTLTRDLINTPVNDMGPTQLAAEALALAQVHGAEISIIIGDDLLAQNYPMVHAVGRASSDLPRVIDLRWGEADAMAVTLVGKGVCFDSGGLNIKSSGGMKLMKKDMGGAAQVLGAAKMIMQLNLPVRLRVLVGAVENSISGNAMRPLDILNSRKGLSVEVGNTDAEGRLVLGDILWEAASEDPALVVDFATLTGAARVALGSELPALFASQPDTAAALLAAGAAVDDPLWQLPLHQPYRAMLESKVADLSNISNSSFGGAITAALFLQEFVKPETNWMHVDVMSWNLRSLPGRPEGGEAMAMRAVVQMIQNRVSAAISG
ncbi:MAG: leucyl aminopeptidase family protein [Synechococcales cyanobacterium RM1_1_8]|nr:leucyl aminopeptidase family protein [Synechococcales cyanobacterium RM1_1_8]